MEQINYTTRESYRGANIDRLTAEQKRSGYQTNEWLTFLQAKATGRNVKKGEHATALCNFIKVKDKESGEDKRHPYYFKVFNLAQTKEAKKLTA